MRQHAACNRPHARNSDFPTLDQSVPQWHILLIVAEPVSYPDAQTITQGKA